MKAIKLLSKECNKYVNGSCMNEGCLVRGGYKRGDAVVNLDMATCEFHEAIQEIKLLQSHATGLEAQRLKLESEILKDETANK